VQTLGIVHAPRTKIVTGAAIAVLITLLLVLLCFTSQSDAPVSSLSFGMTTTKSANFGTFAASIVLPVTSAGEPIFVALVTNNTHFTVQIDSTDVQREYEGGRIVNDYGPSWNGQENSASLMPQGIAALPFAVQRDAKRFRVTFQYRRDGSAVQKFISKVLSKLPLSRLPQRIYSWLRRQGLIDGVPQGDFESPWIPNDRRGVDAGRAALLAFLREWPGATHRER
jgi:hypothetical protein